MAPVDLVTAGAGFGVATPPAACRGACTCLRFAKERRRPTRSRPKAKISTIGEKFSLGLGNAHMDAHVREVRARVGLTLFERKEGFNAACEMLRNGGGVGVRFQEARQERSPRE